MYVVEKENRARWKGKWKDDELINVRKFEQSFNYRIINCQKYFVENSDTRIKLQGRIAESVIIRREMEYLELKNITRETELRERMEDFARKSKVRSDKSELDRYFRDRWNARRIATPRRVGRSAVASRRGTWIAA